METCRNCGREVSLDFVNMWDYCPQCKESPFPAKSEDDQPDAMNQGVHVAVDWWTETIECDCGALVPRGEWERHCESEGE